VAEDPLVASAAPTEDPPIASEEEEDPLEADPSGEDPLEVVRSEEVLEAAVEEE